MAPFRLLLAWRLADMRRQGSPLLNRFSMLMVGRAVAGCPLVRAFSKPTPRPETVRGQVRLVSELQP